jgi:hypothetical protein
VKDGRLLQHFLRDFGDLGALGMSFCEGRFQKTERKTAMAVNN